MSFGFYFFFFFSIGLILYILLYLNPRMALVKDRLESTIPYLIKSGLNEEKLQPFLFPFDWVVIQQGGNNQPGITGNLGQCPCQNEYTVNTVQVRQRQKPNAQQIQNCVNNPPVIDPPFWKCREDCVQVNTHIWQGWVILRNAKKNWFALNCNSFAQYHCKKPNDPAVDSPPKDGPPLPEVEA